jgi:hypothetical protein
MQGRIVGLSDIKTGLTVRAGSMPKVSRDKSLDLYILTRKRARLEGERLALEKRRMTLEAELEEIREKIGGIVRALGEEGRGSCGEVRKEGLPVKKIVMEY